MFVTLWDTFYPGTMRAKSRAEASYKYFEKNLPCNNYQDISFSRF